MDQNKTPIKLISLLCAWLISTCALGDAKVHEWIGTWDMYHDGWKGTLMIKDSKVDCITSPWCHLFVRYTDAQGKQITGSIDKIDQQSSTWPFA